MSSYYTLGQNNQVPVPATTSGNTASGGLFGSIGGFLDKHGSTITNTLGTAASIGGALKGASETKQMGAAVQDYLSGLGAELQGDSQFQGYGVSTGLGNGSAAYDQYGNLITSLGMTNAQDPNAMAFTNNAYNAANNAMLQAGQGVQQSQNDIYSSIMNTQRPQLDQMAAQSNAQEYAMGRGGVMGSQYGGTAEDAAMARARAQASNEAAFKAREMANAEMGMLSQMAGQYGQIGNQGMQAQYIPMQQQIEAMKLGYSNADMAQTGQLTGNDYLAQLLLGGTNANINAQHSANELTSGLYNALLSNVGGAQGSNGSSASGLSSIGGLLSSAGGAISQIPGFSWLSDVRLKTNITEAEVVDGIQYYNWEWTQQAKDLGAESNPTYGVLAQEMLTQRPEAVSVGDHGYLMVDYSKI